VICTFQRRELTVLAGRESRPTDLYVQGGSSSQASTMDVQIWTLESLRIILHLGLCLRAPLGIFDRQTHVNRQFELIASVTSTARTSCCWTWLSNGIIDRLSIATEPQNRANYCLRRRNRRSLTHTQNSRLRDCMRAMEGGTVDSGGGD